MLNWWGRGPESPFNVLIPSGCSIQTGAKRVLSCGRSKCYARATAHSTFFNSTFPIQHCAFFPSSPFPLPPSLNGCPDLPQQSELIEHDAMLGDVLVTDGQNV